MNRTKLILTALTLAVLPAAASAYVITPNTNGFDVVRCNDGTVLSCQTTGPYGYVQIDCPNTVASNTAYAKYCANHGGLWGIVNTLDAFDAYADDFACEAPGQDDGPTRDAEATDRR